MDNNFTKKPIVVFYHADCLDGFGAAWATWRKFGDTAEYFPVFHDGKTSHVSGKEVYMVDIVFEKEILDRLKSENKRVTVIDHHISVKEAALSTENPLFDINHSGCVLAWKYFFPKKPVPKLLWAIEDIDIWKHKVRGSWSLYQYLDMEDFDFNKWSKFVADFENPKKRKLMLEKGDFIAEFQKRVAEKNIDHNARLVKFEGYTVYAINASNFTNTTGEILRTKKPPFAIMWREKKDGSVAVSLRGVGDIDCSQIAMKYGGGGHKLSAAFKLKSINDIPWKPA